jgi:DNA-directed RNA polymerase specialized sigma24 family protein
VFFAQQLVRDSQVSEDIVSETFAKIWLMKDRFDTVPNIKS